VFFPQKSPTMQCIHAKQLHSRVRFPQKESYSTVFSPRKSPKIEMLSNHIWNVTWLTHTWHDPLTHVIWLKMRDITPSHTHIHKHKHPHTHDTWHDPLTHVIWLESLEWHDKYPTHMTPPHTWASSSQGYWASEGCLSSKHLDETICQLVLWMMQVVLWMRLVKLYVCVFVCVRWCGWCCGCDLCVCLWSTCALVNLSCASCTLLPKTMGDVSSYNVDDVQCQQLQGRRCGMLATRM